MREAAIGMTSALESSWSSQVRKYTGATSSSVTLASRSTPSLQGIS